MALKFIKKNNNKFVFVKNNIKVSEKLTIEKNAVGIIESETSDSALIFLLKLSKK
ncbi:MAG: hypothetical protein Q7K55_08405 [Candidatus Levybacteria bacterium]|nr:hypothetical protein [Candidatus Levybacteria bacterium]